MPIVSTPSVDQVSIYSDLSSLDKIRQQGQVDEMGAVKKAAQEFEAFFMNMMLKSMRQASDVIGSDSPFSSQQEKMYTGMLDEQMSVNLSQSGHLRIADLMVSQLSRSVQSAQASQDISAHLSKIKKTGEQTIQPVLPVRSLSSVMSIDAEELSNSVVPLAEKNSKVEKEVISSSNQNEALATKEVNDIAKPEKKAVFSGVSDFVESLMPFAKEAADKLNLDPRILLAQAALETGWGKYVMHDGQGKPGFNMFGIKAGDDWQGDSINIETLEVENQAFKKVKANFRQYQSFAESFNDYVDFVTSSPRYQNAVNAATNARDYLNELQNSGYATDPNYASKILRIFKENNFQFPTASAE